MAKLTRTQAKKMILDANKKLRKVYIEMGQSVFMSPQYERKLMNAMDNLQAIYLRGLNK